MLRQNEVCIVPILLYFTRIISNEFSSITKQLDLPYGIYIQILKKLAIVDTSSTNHYILIALSPYNQDT
jgi:hypothetical protein